MRGNRGQQKEKCNSTDSQSALLVALNELIVWKAFWGEGYK